MSPGALLPRGLVFPVPLSFPKILGIELKVHSPARDGVQLSRQSLFCMFPPSIIFIIFIIFFPRAFSSSDR